MMLHTHEVTGSSPVVSTKKKRPPIGWPFLFGEVRDSNPSKCKCPVDTCQPPAGWRLLLLHLRPSNETAEVAGLFDFIRSHNRIQHKNRRGSS